MALALEPLGRLDIHATASWSIGRGPRGTRSVTHFEKVVWTGPVVEAESRWANGSYLATEHVAEPQIRAFFETTDDEPAQLFLEYRARFQIDSVAREATGQPTPGENPVYLAGRIETDDDRYAWLNATQVVGKGGFDAARLVLSYEIYALR
ncbi:MAG: DUF3237 domain-containing protein [bacterium]|nr:DUF3237 domain-containing protein [bacterium]